MDFNFFDWIRNGVKRSILLGVSDAAGTMGLPPDEESTKDKLLACLRDESEPLTPVRNRLTSSAPSGSQRKLGRSLNEIGTLKEA